MTVISSDSASPKKQKKPKELSPAKILEALVKSCFMTPFMRRLRYLYVGVGQFDASYFIMGSVSEDDLEYGDPNQALALIHVRDDADVALIRGWLAHTLITVAMDLVRVTDLVTVWTKANWDPTKITATRLMNGQIQATVDEQNTIISDPVQSLFTLTKIERTVCLYDKVAFHDTPCHAYPYVANPNEQLALITIQPEHFDPSIVSFRSPIKLAVTKGVDLIDTKLFEPLHPTFIGYKFWIVSGSCMLYMHCCETSKVRIVLSRCNVFLVPQHSA